MKKKALFILILVLSTSLAQSQKEKVGKNACLNFSGIQQSRMEKHRTLSRRA